MESPRAVRSEASQPDDLHTTSDPARGVFAELTPIKPTQTQLDSAMDEMRGAGFTSASWGDDEHKKALGHPNPGPVVMV